MIHRPKLRPIGPVQSDTLNAAQRAAVELGYSDDDYPPQRLKQLVKETRHSFRSLEQFKPTVPAEEYAKWEPQGRPEDDACMGAATGGTDGVND